MPLLLLLSHFSRVRLCATPEMAAHQAPPSLGFSRQEHWSGLSFPSPMHESESEVAQLCPTPSDPMDCSLPGSSIHVIFQARVLEWGAIAFSKRCSYHPGNDKGLEAPSGTRVKDQILEQKCLKSSYHLGNYKGFRSSVPGTGGRTNIYFPLPHKGEYVRGMCETWFQE